MGKEFLVHLLHGSNSSGFTSPVGLKNIESTKVCPLWNDDDAVALHCISKHSPTKKQNHCTHEHKCKKCAGCTTPPCGTCKNCLRYPREKCVGQKCLRGQFYTSAIDRNDKQF